MSVIALRKARASEEYAHLYEQLTVNGFLQGEILESAEQYLVRIDIYDVTLLEERDFRHYKKVLLEDGSYTKKQVLERTAGLRNLQKYWVQKEYGDLIEEIDRCQDVDKKLVMNIKRFLIRHGVHHIGEIDYLVRERYEEDLQDFISPNKKLEYLKNFDKVKQWQLKEEANTIQGIARQKMRYQNQVLFLPYLPNQKLAMDFYWIQDKAELVWDFRQETSERLKRQIFSILMYSLDNIQDPKDRRVRYLLPLKWLYEFCIKEDIGDIEYLEQEQIQSFENIVSAKVVNVGQSMQIVDNSRKILFLCGQDTNWKANVWYLERFHLKEGRNNPSNPIRKLSFLEISNLKNRALIQEYAKYLIGITDLAVSNVRTQVNWIKKFVEYFRDETSICEVTPEQMDTYFIELQDEDIIADTFNQKVIHILKFFQYLKTNKYIEEIPFEPSYYLQKTYPIHHDRSVEKAVYMEILDKTYLFPEVTRLIFLHLWGTGLRISEVCTLKGDAYYWDGEDAWLKVYQIKMRADKMIPIPLILYEIMQKYIQKNKIPAKSYVFKSTDGSAYRVGTFISNFKQCCKTHKIANGEYVFKSHDYRHTLATRFYDDGVSMQTIRDYLGHVTENMTKEYVDYMPKKLDQANTTYFEKPENNLAVIISVKKRGDKHEKKNISV